MAENGSTRAILLYTNYFLKFGLIILRILEKDFLIALTAVCSMKISYRNFINKNPLRVKRKKYYKNKKNEWVSIGNDFWKFRKRLAFLEIFVKILAGVLVLNIKTFLIVLLRVNKISPYDKKTSPKVKLAFCTTD